MINKLSSLLALLFSLIGAIIFFTGGGIWLIMSGVMLLICTIISLLNLIGLLKNKEVFIFNAGFVLSVFFFAGMYAFVASYYEESLGSGFYSGIVFTILTVVFALVMFFTKVTKFDKQIEEYLKKEKESNN